MARMEGQLAVCWTLRPHIDLQDVKILALGTLIEEWPAVLCPQRARNEVACCMSGLLAQSSGSSARHERAFWTSPQWECLVHEDCS